MLEIIVTLVALLLLIAILIGLSAAAMLLVLYGPGAAAAFAAGVQASRMGADPFLAIGIALLAFVVVTALVGKLLRTILYGVRVLLT